MSEIDRYNDVMYDRPFGLYQTKFCGGPALLLLEACQIADRDRLSQSGGQSGGPLVLSTADLIGSGWQPQPQVRVPLNTRGNKKGGRKGQGKG
jgi:hypothetical protein